MRKFWIKEPDFFDQTGPFIKSSSVSVPTGTQGELRPGRFLTCLWFRQTWCDHEFRLHEWSHGRKSYEQPVCVKCWYALGIITGLWRD